MWTTTVVPKGLLFEPNPSIARICALSNCFSPIVSQLKWLELSFVWLHAQCDVGVIHWSGKSYGSFHLQLLFFLSFLEHLHKPSSFPLRLRSCFFEAPTSSPRQSRAMLRPCVIFSEWTRRMCIGKCQMMVMRTMMTLAVASEKYRTEIVGGDEKVETCLIELAQHGSMVMTCSSLAVFRPRNHVICCAHHLSKSFPLQLKSLKSHPNSN